LLRWQGANETSAFMKKFPLLMLGLLGTPISCPTSSLAQTPPAAVQPVPSVPGSLASPLRYAFSESFPTKLWPESAVGFQAKGIAVDDAGQIYLTAKREGIVQYDAHRKYRFSFGYPAPEEEKAGVDQNGNPETGEDMPLSQRAYLRSADGQPFVVMPDAKTLSIAGHLFEPSAVMINGAGQLCTVDNMTGWFQAFTGKGPSSYYEVPTEGGNFHKFLGLAQGLGISSSPAAKPKVILFVLDASMKHVLMVDTQAKLIKSFGGQGSGAGQLQSPNCLGISSENTLFVGDGSRVMVYRADGTFLYSFGSSGDKPGQFTTITGLAVSKAGHVFVLDGGRLQAFTERGTYLGQVAGRGTVPSATGGDAGLHYSQSVAVDRQETVYLVDQTWVKIYKPVR